MSVFFIYFFTHLCYDFFYFLFTTCLPHCYLILHPHVILTLTHPYSISFHDILQHDQTCYLLQFHHNCHMDYFHSHLTSIILLVMTHFLLADLVVTHYDSFLSYSSHIMTHYLSINTREYPPVTVASFC